MRKIALALAIAAGVIVLATSTVNAQTSVQKESLLDTIISKFNLNKNDVNSVIETHRQEKLKERGANYETWIDSLLKSGTITQAQKDLLVSKRKELDAKHESERQELEKWATENNIDLKYLNGRHKMMGVKGRGMKLM